MVSFETQVLGGSELPQDHRWLASSHALDSARPGQITISEFADKAKTVGARKVVPSGTPVAFSNGKVVPATNTLFSGFIADVQGVDVTTGTVAPVAVIVHGTVNVDYLPTGAKSIVEAANGAAGNTAKVKGDFVLVSNKEGA